MCSSLSLFSVISFRVKMCIQPAETCLRKTLLRFCLGLENWLKPKLKGKPRFLLQRVSMHKKPTCKQTYCTLQYRLSLLLTHCDCPYLFQNWATVYFCQIVCHPIKCPNKEQSEWIHGFRKSLKCWWVSCSFSSCLDLF